MELWMIIIILIVGFILFARRVRSNHALEGTELSYTPKETLLTPAERSFYGVLSKALDDRKYIAFAQVRLADILTPAKGSSRSQWQKAFNQISSKHCDFVICDADTMKLRLAVELDDASHRNEIRANRDEFLDLIFKQAGLPLLRIKASRSYVLQDLKAQLSEILEPNSLVENIYTPVEDIDRGSREIISSEDEQPTCPKCGSSMILRTVSKGENAGSQFWGCSKFPRCRGVIPTHPDKLISEGE